VYDNSAGRLTMSAFAITGLTLMVCPSANDGAYSAETFDPMLKGSIHPDMSGNAIHHSVQSSTSHQTSVQPTMFHNPTGISQHGDWVPMPTRASLAALARCDMYGG